MTQLNPVRAGLAKRPSEYLWSSYRYYIGQEEKPRWLTTGAILACFGNEQFRAQKQYQKFTEAFLSSEIKDPLNEVFASALLGGPEFLDWVRENLIPSEKVDMRNVPVLRALVDKPSLEQIERMMESIVGRKHLFFKKLCIYTSHQYGGFSLKEIGAYYQMRDSAVSQASRRFKRKVLEDNKLKRIMVEILNRMGSVES